MDRKARQLLGLFQLVTWIYTIALQFKASQNQQISLATAMRITDLLQLSLYVILYKAKSKEQSPQSTLYHKVNTLQ